MRPGLAGRLRAETQTLHTQVERSPFMAALIKGRVGLQGYSLLLRNLYPLYVELEAGLDRHARLPALAPLYQPRLFRAQAIARDLQALCGAGWEAGLAVLAPAERYRQRLHELARSRPALLAAHAYVRYLGDLSGGQLLSGIVSRSLQLPPGQGRSFYDFGDQAQVAALAAAFRAGLDAVAADDDAAQALVDEAKTAFALHAQLFEALATQAS
ncbi:MAG: heme oxygenase (biliverdin-producing) [Ramlibacter sp.]